MRAMKEHYTLQYTSSMNDNYIFIMFFLLLDHICKNLRIRKEYSAIIQDRFIKLSHMRRLIQVP